MHKVHQNPDYTYKDYGRKMRSVDITHLKIAVPICSGGR